MKNTVYSYKITKLLTILFSVCAVILSICACDIIGGTNSSNNNTEPETYNLTIIAYYSDEDTTGTNYNTSFYDDASIESYLDNMYFPFDYGYVNCGYFTEKNRNGILAFDENGKVTDGFKQYILKNKPTQVSIYRECDPADTTLTLVYEGETKTYNVKMFDYLGHGELFVPEKYGYEFCGWSIYEDGSFPSKDILVEKFDSVYYAKFVPFDVRITLYDTAKSSHGTYQKLQYDNNYTLNYEEREGYNFVGYFSEDNGAGTQFTDKKGESLAPWSLLNETDKYSDRINLYAHYVTAEKYTIAVKNDNLVNSFTVTYMDAYGKETRFPVERIATEAKKFEYVYPHDIPSGYYFSGWYEDSEFRKKYDFSQTLTSNITLYPRFLEIPKNMTGVIRGGKNEAIFSANSSANTTKRYVVAEDATVRIVVHASLPHSKTEIYFGVYNYTSGQTIISGKLSEGRTVSSVNEIKLKAGDILHLSAETNGDPVSVYFEFDGFTEPVGAYADIPDCLEFEVTGGNHYKVKVYPKFDMEFMGYYTAPNGNGTRCTDKKGASLDTYEFASDVKLYPYYEPVEESNQ